LLHRKIPHLSHPSASDKHRSSSSTKKKPNKKIKFKKISTKMAFLDFSGYFQMFFRMWDEE
jgi:hypothetical protein